MSQRAAHRVVCLPVAGVVDRARSSSGVPDFAPCGVVLAAERRQRRAARGAGTPASRPVGNAEPTPLAVAPSSCHAPPLLYAQRKVLPCGPLSV